MTGQDVIDAARRRRRRYRFVPLVDAAGLAGGAGLLASGHRGWLTWVVIGAGALSLAMWLARPLRRCPRCGALGRGPHYHAQWADGTVERHLCDSCLCAGDPRYDARLGGPEPDDALPR